jgi:hypothetical protein
MTREEWQRHLDKHLADSAPLCPFAGEHPVEMTRECISKGYEHCVECLWFPEGDENQELYRDIKMLVKKLAQCGGACYLENIRLIDRLEAHARVLLTGQPAEMRRDGGNIGTASGAVADTGMPEDTRCE